MQAKTACMGHPDSPKSKGWAGGPPALHKPGPEESLGLFSF